VIGIDAALADAVDRLLPQTQCTRCGYPACRPYAEAIAAGEAEINQCPPGGDATIRALAALTGRPHRALSADHGVERPRHVALIDEAQCIGCTLCIQACPVDAISGAPKRMHTVIVELCSGCDLCVPPCPVDCIAMVPAAGDDATWDEPRAASARLRHLARRARLARSASERAERLAERAAALRDAPTLEARRAAIEAALERARAKRATLSHRGARGRNGP
jgi:electron transport complex protein RnfB